MASATQLPFLLPGIFVTKVQSDGCGIFRSCRSSGFQHQPLLFSPKFKVLKYKPEVIVEVVSLQL